MTDWLWQLAAALLYPGLATALAAGLLYRALALGRRPGPGPLGAALGSREGLLAAAGVLCAGLGLAALPWPLRPGGPGGGWVWAWAAFELAFLLPLLPALLAGAPLVVRAAIREAQAGALARAMLWAAAAVGLAIHDNWGMAALPAHLLALLAALLAFPAAVGWGPFDSERGLTPDGPAAGLPAAARALDALARELRAGALLAAALVATLPVAAGSPWLGLATLGAGFVAFALLLRRLDGRLPRLPLPTMIRLGLITLLPLVTAATVALVFV